MDTKEERNRKYYQDAYNRWKKEWEERKASPDYVPPPELTEEERKYYWGTDRTNPANIRSDLEYRRKND